MFSLDLFFFIFALKCMLLLFRLKKMLMMLFAFEFMMVKMLFSFVYLSMPFDPMSFLVFLAVVAGEASMGLTLLVSMLRQSGKDNMVSSSFDLYEGF